jgi:hypothetical protein
LAEAEANDGCNWLSETTKLELPEEVVEETEERKVITRYTPIGRRLFSFSFSNK